MVASTRVEGFEEGWLDDEQVVVEIDKLGVTKHHIGKEVILFTGILNASTVAENNGALAFVKIKFLALAVFAILLALGLVSVDYIRVVPLGLLYHEAVMQNV